MGSNHRHLACKAKYGQEYAQLTGPAHALYLRKPCLEMPWGFTFTEAVYGVAGTDVTGLPEYGVLP